MKTGTKTKWRKTNSRYTEYIIYKMSLLSKVTQNICVYITSESKCSKPGCLNNFCDKLEDALPMPDNDWSLSCIMT